MRLLHGLVLCLSVQVAAAGWLSPPEAPAQSPKGSPSPGAVAPIDGPYMISADSLMSHVRWLADDDRAGRMTGTWEAEQSARWIASHFETSGLLPAGDEGTYFQSFEATVGVTLGVDNALVLEGIETEPLEPGEDFIPFGFSGSGTVEAPLVFVGYGIDAPEAGYNDYAGLDVEGKTVLVLRHEPQQDDAESVFDGTSWSRHAMFRKKAETAKEKGAVAMLVFTGPASESYEEDTLVPLSGEQGTASAGILALHVKKEIGEALITRAGYFLDEWVDAVDRDLKPRSFELGSGVVARLAVSVDKDRRSTANVVGRLLGRDPRAGVVLVGAHYDGLGLGKFGSLSPGQAGTVHNGADDNASGIAALMELARVFAAKGSTRDIIFAAFTGEEIGLLGSSHMAEHPPVPLSDIQTMINMDMVGRPQKETVTVGGAGTAEEFETLIDGVFENRSLEVTRDKSGYGLSDHTSFYVKDVPVLFFFSGLHEDYHRPGDDADKIDREGFLEVTRIIYDAVRDLSNRPDRVTFTKVGADSLGPYGTMNPHGDGDAPSGRGYGPYLGTIPDFGEHEGGGVKLSGVREGSPAEKAGIRGGDVVIRFAGKEISDLYAHTYALRDQQPGDEVEIVLLRDGEEVKVTATLGRRE